jgi:DNA sulfur modification protein DndB
VTALKKTSEAYELSAVRGVQAGRQYYTVMCPLNVAVQLLKYSDSSLPPEVRAQRVLNKQRIPEMKDYILNNKESYVFSALTASVDGDIEFVRIKDNDRIGTLKISMNSVIIINDGQHRQAAIAQALEVNPSLRKEDISIVIFHDQGLRRSQQMFTDLNRHAVRPTKSLNILFDNRDSFSILIKECIEQIPMFRGSVEMEKSTISNRSRSLFTLSGIYHASQDLIKGKNLTDEQKKSAIIAFWNAATANLTPWQSAKSHIVKPDEFRRNYVCAHTIMLRALGTLGHSMMDIPQEKWHEHLMFLQDINWLKSNEEFQGIVLVQERITASRNNQAAFAKYVEKKQALNRSRG